jgi:hypothetical protein
LLHGNQGSRRLPRMQVFAHLYRSGGAPWPTKMGTILSLFPYDAAACRALQWVNLRRPAVLRYVLA